MFLFWATNRYSRIFADTLKIVDLFCCWGERNWFYKRRSVKIRLTRSSCAPEELYCNVNCHDDCNDKFLIISIKCRKFIQLNCLTATASLRNAVIHTHKHTHTPDAQQPQWEKVKVLMCETVCMSVCVWWILIGCKLATPTNMNMSTHCRLPTAV